MQPVHDYTQTKKTKKNTKISNLIVSQISPIYVLFSTPSTDVQENVHIVCPCKHGVNSNKLKENSVATLFPTGYNLFEDGLTIKTNTVFGRLFRRGRSIGQM